MQIKKLVKSLFKDTELDPSLKGSIIYIEFCYYYYLNSFK